ncbi:hypothetical protein PG991_002524 [Apiospora marii]|uniref:Uncharacterized protein n=1 Tax=Apiospora marii TaxID=335849 RepID=A0ABR1SGW6_9PEZI
MSRVHPPVQVHHPELGYRVWDRSPESPSSSYTPAHTLRPHISTLRPRPNTVVVLSPSPKALGNDAVPIRFQSFRGGSLLAVRRTKQETAARPLAHYRRMVTFGVSSAYTFSYIDATSDGLEALSYTMNPNSQIPTPKSQLPNPNSQIPTPKSQLPNPNSQIPTPIPTEDN